MLVNLPIIITFILLNVWRLVETKSDAQGAKVATKSTKVKPYEVT